MDVESTVGMKKLTIKNREFNFNYFLNYNQ